jgi:hypothetical protein
VESEFWKSVQRGSSRTSEFYLRGDPDNVWVQAAKPDPFWVAIKPFQRGSRLRRGLEQEIPREHGKAAVTTSLRRRPPEPHPGRIKSVMIGIKLKRNKSGLFPTVYDR